MAELDHQRKISEVWASLAPVTDPELDESVTEMGFVSAVEIDGRDNVDIHFRLPTYWCAPNFAFLMADDMCRSVRALPWTDKVKVTLTDHLYAEVINEGIEAGRSFKETFAGEAEGNLDEIRETFRRKAYQRRQEALIRALLDRDHGPGAIVAMTLAGLEGLPLVSADDRRLLARYIDMRRERHGGDPSVAAFLSVDGEVLEVDSFMDYMKDLRRVRLNTEMNGAICRGLLQARYGESDEESKDGPELLDFIARHAEQRKSDNPRQSG